jgi:formate dehydrogenase gamma subunit
MAAIKSRAKSSRNPMVREGKKKKKKIIAEDMIQFTSPIRRYIHWFTFGSFFLALVTGILIMYKVEAVPEAFSGVRGLLNLHVLLGALFSFGMLIMLFQWLPHAVAWKSYDTAWLANLGGYFRKWAPVPPAGRLNGGQKLWTLGFFLLAFLSAATGAVLFLVQSKGPGHGISIEMHRYAVSIHTFCYAAMCFLVLIHIYFAGLATHGNFDVIWSGMVKLTWVERHHSEWCKTSKEYARRLEEKKHHDELIKLRRERIAQGLSPDETEEGGEPAEMIMDSGEEAGGLQEAPAEEAVEPQAADGGETDEPVEGEEEIEEVEAVEEEIAEGESPAAGEAVEGEEYSEEEENA